MIRKLLLVGAMWAAGCATTGAEPVNQAAAEILAGHERTGDVVTCLNVRQISTITAVDEKTLLVRAGVNDYYVSDLKSRCNGVANRFTRIEYTTSTGQLCRGEILRIVENSGNFLTGSCGMGSFERLVKKPPAE